MRGSLPKDSGRATQKDRHAAEGLTHCVRRYSENLNSHPSENRDRCHLRTNQPEDNTCDQLCPHAHVHADAVRPYPHPPLHVTFQQGHIQLITD